MHRPSPHRRVGSLSPLALALALGLTTFGPTLNAALPSKSLLAQQPLRAAKAQEHLMGLRAQLGLGEREAFVQFQAFNTPRGKTVIRLDHTFQGYRVLGSQAIVHVAPDGTLNTLTRGVEKGIALTGEPALSPDKAVAIALKCLGAQAPLKFTPKVERIVFPAEAVGGLVTTWDAATGRQVLDRSRSALPLIPTAHVWAYEVRTKESNGAHGPREMAYIIDGNTGQILRAIDMLQRQAITPATGTGHGHYSGDNVPLPTTLLLDGKYALLDTTRGRLPNPWLETFGTDPSGWIPTGLQTWFSGSDANGITDYSMWFFMENPTNTWGDGLPFTQWGNLAGANGQTAGVDAHSALTTTWDFYTKVLGWDGLDGKGTTVYAEVLSTDRYYVDNAYWSPWSFNLMLGAGSSTLPPGHPSYNPAGFKSMADFDVIAHEMAHGLTTANRWVNGAGSEEAGMAEGTSDFFAQMAKIWAQRPAGAPDDAIPATGGDWQIGQRITPDGKPLRWMDKPSRDQRNADAWYDGAHYLDGHFSAGILNRALYFLSQGASAVRGSDTYSPYLPGGMTGIGNDAAARIWFTTVTERLAGGGQGALKFQDCREEAIAAAKDLYGAGSDCIQSIAVENAFAAINVGLGHGQAPRTEVRFASFRNGDWYDLSHSNPPGNPNGPYRNRQLFPEGMTVNPKISVFNNANTAVTWTLGGPSLFNNGMTPGQYGWADKGGKLNPDGSWTTPWDLGWYALTATSQADPTQFAEGRCFLIGVDTDQDGEFDACDMGGISLSWWLGRAITPSHSIFHAPWTDDADVFGVLEAMQNAWPVK
jgi:Zn-dependent metalloprotease